MTSNVPLIITTGTSMDSGKTTVAIEITKSLTRMGMKLAGAKLTGVGAMRDLYKMQDYGYLMLCPSWMQVFPPQLILMMRQ